LSSAPWRFSQCSLDSHFFPRARSPQCKSSATRQVQPTFLEKAPVPAVTHVLLCQAHALDHLPPSNTAGLTTISLETISIISMSIFLGDGSERLGFFSERLLHGMAKLKISCKKLAPKLGCSYEYVRRMALSESFPSPKLLSKMCAVFCWNRGELQQLVMLDQCRKKFGPTFWLALGKNPRMEPVYILFPYFTPAEQDLFISLLRSFAESRSLRLPRSDVPGQPVAEL